jgi:hypothetical protein
MESHDEYIPESESGDESESVDDSDIEMEDESDDEKIPKKKPKLKEAKVNKSKLKKPKVKKPKLIAPEPSSSRIDALELFNNAKEDEVVFNWTETELKEILFDYVRFVVFKTAFPNIDSNPGPYEKLLKSYKMLNTEINSMCNFMITHLDLPEELVNSIRRHSQRVASYRKANEPCMVCQQKPCNRLQYLGPNYNKFDLKIEKTSFPPQLLFLCNLHAYVADTFFSLVHMKWNIHLNIEHRIKERKLFTRGNEDIAEDIGDDVITV